MRDADAYGEAAAEGRRSSIAAPVAPQAALVLALSTGVWILHTVLAGVAGHRLGMIAGSVVAVGLAGTCLWAHLRPGASGVCTHLAAGLVMIEVVGLAWMTGQTHSPLLWSLICVALLAGYLRGARAAIGWTVAGVLAVAATEAGRRVAPVPPEYTIEGAPLAAHVITTLLVVLAFSVATLRRHARHVDALTERNRAIRRQLDKAGMQVEEISRARDEAVALAESKGDFLAVMSHEIRTPLNAVLGLSGVLLDAPLPGEQRDVVRMIRSSGDTLLGLVNNILDFSKIEAGRLTLEEAPFDIGDSMEDALDLFATVAAEKELDLSCHIAPEVPERIRGDAARVRQILVNFVSNAVKFTPHGSIQVHAGASLVPGDPTGLLIHCEVRDTGMGIPEERLGELFQSFWQVDASTTRRFGGTGLGLAICRSLAEHMGGRVWAESVKGEGATFHVTFRARMVLDTQTAPFTLARSTRSALVVSSREGMRRSVIEYMRTLGLRGVPCARAAQVPGAIPVDGVSVVVADAEAATIALRDAVAALTPSPPVVLLVPAMKDTDARRGLRELWPAAQVVALPLRRLFLREALVHLLTGRERDASPTRDSEAPLATQLPLRVLVAEDNPVNQKVMELLLDRLGYRADLVGNGGEAVDAVRARPYDLVLMDMRMPEMDGVEATRRIRAEVPAEHQPRIVALTAAATKEDRDSCLAAGMDDFLTKPIVTDELVRAIRATPRRPPRSGGSAVRARPTGAPGELAVSQLDELRRLTSDSEGLFAQIIDEYLTSADRLIRELETALGQPDSGAVARAAHTLKGSSAQMGAVTVAQHAAGIEAAAARGAIDEAKEMFATLRTTYVAVAEQLQQLKGKL